MEEKASLIYSDSLATGGYPDDCPLDSARAGRTVEIIQSLGLLNYQHCSMIAPEPASRESMERFHVPEYLDALYRCGKGNHDFRALQMGLGTPDNPIFKDMFEYLALASGGTTLGANLILKGDAHVVFNLAGGFHHATSDRASGFCFINDVVLGCMTLADAGKRVLLLDLDAHHGDGTQTAFYNRDDIMTISMHESGKTLFPGTGMVDEIGIGKGKGFSVNLPLPVGTYDDIYYQAFQEAVMPLMQSFNPDVIVLELGMDALAGDPLAHLNLTNNCYADIVADVIELKTPVLAVGGGGYNSQNTVRSWALMWNILANGRDDNIANLGLSGVLLENTAWSGGLRDKPLLSHGGHRVTVEQEVKKIITQIKNLHFKLHNL